MVKSCAAYGCRNRWSRGSGLHFFEFPLNNQHLLRRWLNRIKRKNFIPTEYNYICSAHFMEDDYKPTVTARSRRMLKPEAVPSIFSFPSHKQPPPKKPRRKLIRNQGSKNPTLNEDDVDTRTIKLESDECYNDQRFGISTADVTEQMMIENNLMTIEECEVKIKNEPLCEVDSLFLWDMWDPLENKLEEEMEKEKGEKDAEKDETSVVSKSRDDPNIEDRKRPMKSQDKGKTAKCTLQTDTPYDCCNLIISLDSNNGKLFHKCEEYLEEHTETCGEESFGNLEEHAETCGGESFGNLEDDAETCGEESFGNLEEHIETCGGESIDTAPMSSEKIEKKGIRVGGPPCKCNECHKIFKMLKALEVRMRKHTGEHPYERGKCHKRFTQLGNLKAQIHNIFLEL